MVAVAIVVKPQSEGSALFGLSAALMGNITIDKGRVMQPAV
jgi:CO/xanthine dehydrogenase Mo-binding subunit